MQEHNFFHDALQTFRWDWIRFDQNFKKKSHIKHSCFSLEKSSRLFTISPNFISIYKTFSRSGKLLGKFQDFFKNSRLCTNPEWGFSFPRGKILRCWYWAGVHKVGVWLYNNYYTGFCHLYHATALPKNLWQTIFNPKKLPENIDIAKYMHPPLPHHWKLSPQTVYFPTPKCLSQLKSVIYIQRTGT